MLPYYFIMKVKTSKWRWSILNRGGGGRGGLATLVKFSKVPFEDGHLQRKTLCNINKGECVHN